MTVRFQGHSKPLGLLEKKDLWLPRTKREPTRRDFRRRLASGAAEQWVFADESGMDSRDEYAYGYSPRGERLHALKSGRRSGRVNMIAAYCNGHLLAPFTVWKEPAIVRSLKPG